MRNRQEGLQDRLSIGADIVLSIDDNEVEGIQGQIGVGIDIHMMEG